MYFTSKYENKSGVVKTAGETGAANFNINIYLYLSKISIFTLSDHYKRKYMYSNF